MDVILFPPDLTEFFLWAGEVPGDKMVSGGNRVEVKDRCRQYG